MPLIKSAKKKLRQDKKRQKQNKSQKDYLKEVLKSARKEPAVEIIRIAVRATDKAVKKHIIHKNKAARIKSALSKLIVGNGQKPVEKKKITKKKTSLKKTSLSQKK